MKGYRGNPYRDFFIMIWIVLAFCLVLSFTGIQDFRIDESDYSKLSEFFEKYPIFKIVVSSVYLSLQYYLVCSAILGRWCKKEIIPISAFGKHWSKEQTDQFRGSHDANDFYAGLNLIYSIFRKDKYSTTDYVELTNAFIEVDDRLIKYYYFVV